jgi:dCMP deaminase
MKEQRFPLWDEVHGDDRASRTWCDEEIVLTKSYPPPGANMAAALGAAAASPNRVRQVGAVLVTRDEMQVAACNTFPSGVRDLEDRHAGDGRFVWMEHAERHAIFEAARRGLATAGGHLTTTFFPCIDCARAIVDSGIACLDTPAPAFNDAVWGQAFERSQVILQEGGVEIRLVDATNETGSS